MLPACINDTEATLSHRIASRVIDSCSSHIFALFILTITHLMTVISVIYPTWVYVLPSCEMWRSHLSFLSSFLAIKLNSIAAPLGTENRDPH